MACKAHYQPGVTILHTSSQIHFLNSTITQSILSPPHLHLQRIMSCGSEPSSATRTCQATVAWRLAAEHEDAVSEYKLISSVQHIGRSQVCLAGTKLFSSRTSRIRGLASYPHGKSIKHLSACHKLAYDWGMDQCASREGGIGFRRFAVCGL